MSAWFALFAAIAVAWEEHGRLIVAGAAVLTALGVFWRFVVKPIYEATRRMVHFVDDLHDVMGAVREQLLTNNGGSTLKDKIEATHSYAQSIDGRVKRLEGKDN